MLNQRLIRAILIVFALSTIIFFTNNQRSSFGQTNGLLPWVVGTTPTRGAELAIDKSVSFTFNTAMNRASVETALSVSPATPGTLTWQDDTNLTFLPNKPLNRETAYIFQIDSSARSDEGVGLRDTFSLKLYTAGYLAVTQFFPEGDRGVTLKPTITLVFNRPVVPLGTAEQMKAAPTPFTTTPAIEGKGEWLTTSIYTLNVTTPLKDDTEYQFTIPKSLTDTSGSTLKEDKVFKFRTIDTKPPEPETFWVRVVIPDDKSTKIWRTPRIRIHFNVPPDVPTAEAGFSLIDPNGRILPGKFEYNEKENELIFRPAEFLDYSTRYTIKLDRTNIRSKAGLPLLTSIEKSFTTVGLPYIAGVSPGDGSLVSPATDVIVQFSAPMKLDDFAKRVEVVPKTPFVVLNSDIGADGMSARVQFFTLPSTTYTITVNTKDLVDKWGTSLQITDQPALYRKIGDDNIQFRYVTSALRPAVSLETAGQQMGLYNGYHQTRVFVTHRNINAVGLTLQNLSLPLFLNAQYNQQRRPDETEKLVRRWVAPVYNPPNVMRYDLLSITLDGTSIGQQGNIVCIEAAPSILAVGQTVRVVRKETPANDTTPSAPAPVIVRSAPGTQNTVMVGRANNGMEFGVIDGPICADRYVWWKVQSAEGTLIGWIPEGDLKQPYVVPLTDPASSIVTPIATDSATITPTTSPTASAPDPNTDISKGLSPGIYRLEMDAPDITDGSQRIGHVMLIATQNITLKVGRREALAWVTDLKTGKPSPGLTVQFYRLMRLEKDIQKVLPYGAPITTDKDGFARLVPNDEFAVTGEMIYAAVVNAGQFGITTSNWTQGIDTADFQQPAMVNDQDIALYLYTDRRLYKPGEIVYFKGTIRNRSDGVYTLSDKKLIPVDVIDPQNKVVYSKKVAVNEYGSFSDSFTVDSGAQLGEYQVIARPNKPDPKPEGVLGTLIGLITVPTSTAPPAIRPVQQQRPDDPQFVTQITIGNYTPPEFRVNLTPEAQRVAPGDKIRVKVDSSYYFGGPVSNGVVQWEVRTDPYYFYYTGSGAYSFEEYNQDRIAQDYEDDRPQMVSNGSGKTDENGLYTIEIPAALGKSRRSLVYTIEALVWDQANMSVADRVQVVINQGQFQVGVGVDNYVGTVNEAQNIRLITVNHDSSPLPDKALDVKIVQRAWSSVQTIEPGTGRTIWENEVTEKEITTAKVTTDANGKATFNFTPAAGGAYKIYVSTRDGKDNLIKSSTFVWIAGTDYVAWREPNSNRIDLQADKTGYKVGDVASILIPTPFQGEATALITIERGGILRKEVITLTGNSTIYKLPITLDMSPNAFFSVTVIKGEDKNNFTAAFRTGLIQLQVDTERLGLNIAVTSDRSKTAPREQVTYKLKVTDYAGNPVQAEVGLALVDEAVLALMPDDLPSLMAYFYSRQGLGIRTANALIYSVDQKTREIINVQKGGGKGGNDYFGIFTIRQKFITTPLWQPSVITNKNGEATVTVTLPDQLTTWVLDARAYTLPMGDAKTTLVGQTTQSIVSTRPVLIRPEVPRFYVVGDNSVLSAIVNNNTDAAQEVAVTLEAAGVSVKNDLVQYATIPANDRMKFDWPMTVSDEKAVDLTFKVTTKDGSYTDAAKPVTGQGEDRLIPILRYQTPDTVTTGGIIGSEGGNRIEGLLAPPTGAGKDDTLNIRVDRSLASATTAALKTLKIYPYYCIEQTVSRFLPDAVMYQMQRKLNIKDTVLGDELSSTLQTTLQRLYADQHADGGWGWFVNDSSDQLVTAYAVLGLSEVRAAGWMVDRKSFDRAVEFLRISLKDVNEETPAWDLNRQAFILYVLARSSQIDADTRPPYHDVSRTVKLFDQRDRMNLDAVALLSMTFKAIEPESGYHTTPLLDTLKKAAKITISGRYWQEKFSDMWNWTTDTRTTAIILKALVEVEPTSPLIPDAVRWLVTARKYDAWETTQETAWSVIALSVWMQRTGDLTPDYTFGVKLNEKALVTDEKATPDNVRDPFGLRLPVAEMLQDRVNRIAIERGAGKGTLYYSAQLQTYLPVEKVQAVSRGLAIERKYSLATDKDNKPITSAKAGERIRVTLTIIVPEALNYVAIEDPIPAGTQSINTSFQTSQRINVSNPMEYGWLYWVFTHKELRDDRTVLYAPYLPPGTYIYSYELRAGVPGTYHVMPAHGHAFYMPEIFGRTNGQLFTLEAATE